MFDLIYFLIGDANCRLFICFSSSNNGMRTLYQNRYFQKDHVPVILSVHLKVTNISENTHTII